MWAIRKSLNLIMVLAITVLTFITSVYQVEAKTVLQKANEGNYLLELSFPKGITMNDFHLLIDEINTTVKEVRITLDSNGSEITYGINNLNMEDTKTFKKILQERVEKAIFDHERLTGDQLNVTKVQDSIKVRFVSFQGLEEEIKKTQGLFAEKDKVRNLSTANMQSKVISLKERGELLKKMANAKKKNELHKNEEISNKYIEYEYSSEEIKEMEQMIEEKNKYQQLSADNKDDIKSSTIVTNEVLGGPNYNNGACNTSELNPRCGDGQDRLKLKARFHETGEIYNWAPEYTRATIEEIDPDWNIRKLSLQFKWSRTALSHLRIDENEAFEAEIKFYNFGPGEGIPGHGYAYMNFETVDWCSNLPGVYNDTRFMDEDTEKSFAVGTTHVQDLVEDTEYYFWQNGVPQNYQIPQNGLYSINYQRGYWLDSTNDWYRGLRGDGDEWFVFNEEYESYVVVKQYHKYDSAHYAPGSYEREFRISWADDTNVSIGNLKDSTSIPTINFGESIVVTTGKDAYSIHRFHIDEPREVTIKTQKYSGDSKSYDPTFVLLKHQDWDDRLVVDDVYERVGMIPRWNAYPYTTVFLEKGTYYVIVYQKVYVDSSLTGMKAELIIQ